jgi:hypothetical protein
MAEPVPAGSDVSAGTYDCTNCGHRLDVWGQPSICRRARRAATGNGAPSVAATPSTIRIPGARGDRAQASRADLIDGAFGALVASAA